MKSRKECIRVVYANNYVYLRGGSERVMMEEIEQFRKEGHKVIIFGRIQKGSNVEYPNRDLFPPVVDLAQQK